VAPPADPERVQAVAEMSAARTARPDDGEIIGELLGLLPEKR